MITRYLVFGRMSLVAFAALGLSLALPAQPESTPVAEDAVLKLDPEAAVGWTAYHDGKYAEALAAWRQAAKRGVPEAYSGLGLLYAEGSGVAQDAAAARGFLERAVAQGHVASCLRLAKLLLAGEGGPKDVERARKLLEEAATQDSDEGYGAHVLLENLDQQLEAEAAMAEDQKEQEAIARDQRPGADEFRTGLDAFAFAKFNQALAAWKAAADQGHAAAFGMLGVLHANGSGVRFNAVEARRVYAQGAVRGDVASMLELARAWQEGIGGPADSAQAKYWYDRALATPVASANYHTQAKQQLALLEEVAIAAAPLAVTGPRLMEPPAPQPEDFEPPVLTVDQNGRVMLPFPTLGPLAPPALERAWRAEFSAAFSERDREEPASAALGGYLGGLERETLSEEDKAVLAQRHIEALALWSFTALGKVFPMTEEEGRWTQWLTPLQRDDLRRLRQVYQERGDLRAAGFSNLGWDSADLLRAREAEQRNEPTTRLRALRAAAAKGSPGAMMTLAAIYREGQVVPADPARALRWLHLAAMKQHGPALLELAKWQEQGWSGLAADKGMANRWRYLAREMLPPIIPRARISKTQDPANATGYLSGYWDLALRFKNGQTSRSRIKFTPAGGGTWTLDYDVGSASRGTTEAKSSLVRASAYDSRPITHLSFSLIKMGFNGALRDRSLQGEFWQGTWTALRRIDLDYLDYASAAAQDNRPDDAIHYYTQAIAQRPQDPLYHQRRSNLYYELRDYEPALADVTEALSLQPADTYSIFNRALIHHELGRYQEAINDITFGLAVAERNKAPADFLAQFYQVRARAHLANGAPEKAVEDYAAARKLNPALPQSRDEMLASWSVANKTINEVQAKLAEDMQNLTETMRQHNATRTPAREANPTEGQAPATE